MRRRQNEIKIFEIEHVYEIEITKSSEMLTKSLGDNLRKKLAPRKSQINVRLSFGEAKLERILGVDGFMTRPITAKKEKREEE